MKRLKIKGIVIAVIILLLLILARYYYLGALSPHVSLTKTTFNQLPAWQSDSEDQALLAFQRSCQEILKRDPNTDFSKLPQSGKVSAWQTICLAAQQVKPNDAERARKFFEDWFEPYQVKNNFNARGLFTGYYLPLLHGSLKPNKQFSIPVYALPNDLIKINLGLFRHDLVGTTLIAQQKNNALLPYPDRAAINQGAISKNAHVLLWGDNALDLFFAQIQGSAIVELPDHQRVLIHYAGTNGQPYSAIGNYLIANNALTPQSVSMQTIREWLEQHPQQINTILNRNASYVFFSLMKNADPLGSEQVPLSPERSLAVDVSVVPLGVPIWLDTTVPQKIARTTVPFRHLVVAQDTGGAIKGIVRGDVYWGAGDDAAFNAGHMQSPGQFWILLPRSDLQ